MAGCSQSHLEVPWALCHGIWVSYVMLMLSFDSVHDTDNQYTQCLSPTPEQAQRTGIKLSWSPDTLNYTYV